MKLPIVKYGNAILRAKGKRIEQVDERIRSLVSDMLETMHASNGIGLAAQQVGAALQLTVLDISQVEDRPSTMKFCSIRKSDWMKRWLLETKVVSVFPISPPISIAPFP